MGPMTRREFFGKTAAGATAAGFMLASAGTASANPLGLPIGSQTYPHRAMIADGKFVDLLKQLKSIGVDQIELCGNLGGAGYPEFKSLADGKGHEEDHRGQRPESRQLPLPLPRAPRQPRQGDCLVEGSGPGADDGADREEWRHHRHRSKKPRC